MELAEPAEPVQPVVVNSCSRFYRLLLGVVLVWLMHTPRFVWAGVEQADPVPDSPSPSDQYLEQMKKTYGFKPGTMDSMDWVLVVGGTVASVMILGAFVYWFYKLITRLIQIRHGRARLADGPFWKRMTMSLLLIISFMCGLIFTFFEKFWSLSHPLLNGGG